jgi:hypothetical protein
MIQQSRPHLGLGFMVYNPVSIIIRPQEKQFFKENFVFKGKYDGQKTNNYMNEIIKV